MAKGKLILSNKLSQMKREAPVGFSWTVFFFGFFPPLFRGDWKWFAILLVLNVLTWGLAGFVMSFFYNKLYIKDLLNNGYRAVSATYTEDLEMVAGDLDMPLSILSPVEETAPSPAQ